MTPLEIRTIIQDIVAKLGFKVSDIEERFDPITESTVYNILCDDSRSLIGRNGDTMRALSHIVHRFIDAKKQTDQEYPQFSIDIDDYSKKRIETLRSKVTILANRVRSFSAEQAMEPTSSYERLIVHTLVAELPDISSESRGQGRERHIVLKYTPVN